MEKFAIFGLSANPPTNSHLLIVQKIAQLFVKVFIIPRGTNLNKPSTITTTHSQRKEMVRLAFSDLPNIEIDFRDLDENSFSPTWLLDQKYKTRFPNPEIWHVVGKDLINGGGSGNSEIQKTWKKGKEIWDNLNWAVIDQPNCQIIRDDLPPNNLIIKMGKLDERSTEIRERISAGLPITGMVPFKVEKFIIKNGLYK